MHRFRDIIAYFRQYKDVTWLTTPVEGTVCNPNAKPSPDANILYHFRVIASYSSKVPDFNLPICDWRRGPSSNFAAIFGVRKLESLVFCVALFGLPCFSRFDTIPGCVRHTHTHTHLTHGENIYHDRKKHEKHEIQDTKFAEVQITTLRYGETSRPNSLTVVCSKKCHRYGLV